MERTDTRKLPRSGQRTATDAPADAHETRASIMPFTIAGLAAVIAGGLLAAAIAPAPTEPLVWMVAYIVLIMGVAQAALGVGQARLADPPLTRTRVWVELALFNVANVCVMGGRLLNLPLIVDVGGVLMVAALIAFLLGGRGAAGLGTLRWLYRIMIVLLLISVPVGLMLAQLRAS